VTERDLSTRASDWELIVEARTRRARGDLAALAGRDGCDHERAAADKALTVVETILEKSVPLSRRPQSWWTGSRVERAWRALHEAEIYITVADPELIARLPALRARVAIALPKTDPRRRALETLKPATGLTQAERAIVIDTVRGGGTSTANPDHYANRTFLLGRKVPPDEVAGMVRHLSGPLARTITGQVFHVNGGGYLGG